MNSNLGVEGVSEASGWSARLALRFELERWEHRQTQVRRTILTERQHQGPLRFLKPLYPEGDQPCHAVIIHPPGGIVSGDYLQTDIHVDSRAETLVTMPGAQKWYRSSGVPASAKTNLWVDADAALEWLPQESMLFDGTKGQQHLSIHLHQRALFFGWEVLCLGRTTRGERFCQGNFQQRIDLVRNNRLLWSERMKMLGNDALMSSVLGLNHFPVSATAWLAYPSAESCGASAERDAALLASLRGAMAQMPRAAVSCVEEGFIVVKLVGEAPEALRNLLILLWRTIRPSIFGREAVLPRIWST